MFLPQPLPLGVTAVTGVRLYSDEERTEGEQTPPVALVEDRWHVDTLNVPAGRWWASVDAMKGAVPYAYPLLDPVDLPEDDRLIVSPEALATQIKMALPLDADQRATLRQAILDAQSDVVAYLGQPLMPRQYVEQGVWPAYDGEGGWDLRTPDAGPVVKIISVVEEVDVDSVPLNTYTITYLAGINARDEDEYEPIRRYVIAHAANTPEVLRLWREVVKPAKVIKSSSTEGQSVTYEVPTLGGGGAAGSGSPGALPLMSSLDTWRVAGRRVWQGRTQFGVRYGV